MKSTLERLVSSEGGGEAPPVAKRLLRLPRRTGSLAGRLCSLVPSSLRVADSEQWNQSCGKAEVQTTSNQEPEATVEVNGEKSASLIDEESSDDRPMPLREPGKPKYPARRPAGPPKKKLQSKRCIEPVLQKVSHQKLDEHAAHLPFFTKTHYNRSEVLTKVSQDEETRKILNYGRYYIESDDTFREDVWTILTDEEVTEVKKKAIKKHEDNRSDGRENRIVDLFMSTVLGWTNSRKIDTKEPGKHSCICLLWLGRGLAQKFVGENNFLPPQTSIFKNNENFESFTDFNVINYLPFGVFFNDTEAFCHALRNHVLRPGQSCSQRFTGYLPNATADDNCGDLQKRGAVTRRLCHHQNLSLSVNPCLVDTCYNKGKIICDHIYAFIPETINVSTYHALTVFVERFRRVEDLKGCIFVTKPSYLRNGRGIKFFTKATEVERFFQMSRGRLSGRHGILLQRYIECPRLFDGRKFSLRYFILIVVLPHRRVLGFIHYGIAFFCKEPYVSVKRQQFEPDEEKLEGKLPDAAHPIEKRTIGRVETTEFSKHVHLSNHISPSARDKLEQRVKANKVKHLTNEEDNAFYTTELLPLDCETSSTIYMQMLYAGQCVLDYMQPIVEQYAGCFQTVGLDAVIDARNKLWILGASTNPFSSMLTHAPKQRDMMSSILQESLGLTIECFFKDRKNLKLAYDRVNKCRDNDAFCFAQSFNLFYETDFSKQSGYVPVKAKRKPHVTVEERYDIVDQQIANAAELARQRAEKKRQEYEDRRKYIGMVREKTEEES